MIEDEFPDFYHRADAHSMRWQIRYLWSEKVQLVALLLAAGIAALGGPPFPVVLLFGVALVAQVFRLASHADEKWWNGRAGAESTKTASWLFVVGGEPFDAGNPQADVELASRISEVAKEVARLVPVPARDAHVTAGMRALRGQPLGERIEVYRRERIRSQRDWYATKSEFNEKRSTAWSSAAIAASGLALGFGIAAAVYEWSLDAIGFFSAAGASFVAWIAVKQYQTLARSYAVASAELSAIEVQIESQPNWTESEWGTFVNAAEDAISREHTSWRASRAV
jgi:SMODS and SLOG-associating 2TM effector domain 1/SMODS and SLOG-associating 2TM effector domain 3